MKKVNLMLILGFSKLSKTKFLDDLAGMEIIVKIWVGDTLEWNDLPYLNQECYGSFTQKIAAENLVVSCGGASE